VPNFDHLLKNIGAQVNGAGVPGLDQIGGLVAEGNMNGLMGQVGGLKDKIPGELSGLVSGEGLNNLMSGKMPDLKVPDNIASMVPGGVGDLTGMLGAGKLPDVTELKKKIPSDFLKMFG